MRLAWFSPLSPRLSGLAAYSAGIVAALARGSDLEIDVYVGDGDPAHLGPRLGSGVAVRAAHDFVWRRQRRPYDLAVYQLANAASHAYMMGYVVRYPGLAVLHDTVLHAARRALGRQEPSPGGYRAELRHERPELHDGVGGIAGLPVPHLLACWPLLRPVLETARRTAVHDGAVADELRRRHPGCRIDVLRFGVTGPDEEGRPDRRGPIVFAAVAHTARVGGIERTLRALRRVRRETPASLRILGAVEDAARAAADVRAAGVEAGAVTLPAAEPAGDASSPDSPAGADVCVALQDRPGEVTDSWLRCLAAARPTIVSARARLAGVPMLDPRSWRDLHGGSEDGVAVGIEPRHEEEMLWLAMRRLAVDGDLRRTLGARARSWWEARSARHAWMVEDYRRLLHDVTREPPGEVRSPPAHLRSDGMELARRIADDCGLVGDPFGPGVRAAGRSAHERKVLLTPAERPQGGDPAARGLR